jgi:hypothetical protein
MLTEAESAIIHERAFIPEHLVHYVEPVSGKSGYFHEGYLVFAAPHLTLVGYPLMENAPEIGEALRSACRRFRPDTVSVVAPHLSHLTPDCRPEPADDYFLLDLPAAPLPAERAYMIRRASREVFVQKGTWGAEHARMVEDFICTRGVGGGHGGIFRRIPVYLAHAESAELFEARLKETLSAFTVADFGSSDYAFYMFHFRSGENFVPGASDLLLHRLLQEAHAQGKRAVNLGLGINPGNRGFKSSWGGRPFLRYLSCTIAPPGGRGRMFHALLRQIRGSLRGEDSI